MLSPINNLYTELLEAIFAFCITPDLAHVYHISHVSQYWRTLTLTFPALWRTIHLSGKSSPEFVRVNQLIQRSGARDLRLCVGPGSYDMLARVNHMGTADALKHLTCHLHVTEFNDRPFLELLVLLKFPMPVLTAFWLEAPVVYAPHDDALPPLPASPLLRGLMHILRAMPYLEELEFIGFLPAQALTPSPIERLTIPHLARLALRGTFQECAALLGLISFPETVRAAFTCQPQKLSDGVTTQLTQFLTALGGARQGGAGPFGALAPRKLCVALTYTTIELRALHPDTPYPEPLMRLDFMWSLAEGRAIDTMVSPILSALPLHDVHYLYLRNTGVVRSDVWATQLPRLQSVRVLHHHGDLASLLRVLSSDISSGTASLSTLTDIELTQMPLGTPGDAGVQVRNVDLLARWTRVRSGLKLRTLRLRRCSGMSPEMFEELQSAVDNVTWDGV
ncbi:hypothetical protein BD779DRAFT_1668681 [Infundibulicybe gibba]|nr:hypothetical protein BD779DRAFT_1668681 [Infundibulicybe gibba]